jgi:teichuronic acid biosynthesis glycosyltransferase TuaC
VTLPSESAHEPAHVYRVNPTLRVLILTKIFPNAVEPLSAPFNRQQFEALSKLCHVEVLATVPWFPGARFAARSSAGKLTAVPKTDVIAGLPVRHPRTLFLPRMAHGLWGPLYAASLAPLVVRYRGKVDVVLGSWAYPDGFAAVMLAKALGVPAVVKLHGSDINSIAEMPGPKRLLKWSLPQAAQVVAVSRALAEKVQTLGVSPTRISVVMNGVDGDTFCPHDRGLARQQLQLAVDEKIALYVGNLKQAKGVFDLLESTATWFAAVPSATLALVGGGESATAVAAFVAALPPSQAARIRVVGPQDKAQVAQWMAACDVLVLPSWNEGTPNVVLEALASGRRVVATSVGGTPDLLADQRLGELVPAKQPSQLADAIIRVLQQPYDPTLIATLGARGSWQASAQTLFDVLNASVDRASRVQESS